MANDHDDPDDDALWAAYTKGIKPINTRAAKISKRPRRVLLRPRDDRPALPPLLVKALPINTPDRQTQRKVKRGTWEIGAEIDLHGMTQTQAHQALMAFLQQAVRRGHKCVRIITGKSGKSSGTGIGVLRQKLPEWLQSPPIGDYIISLHHPPAHQGGTGVTIVILRKMP